MWRRRCFHGINAMILMPQIFDVTANENARYKRNELEWCIHLSRRVFLYIINWTFRQQLPLSFICCINQCACDVSNCRTNCWPCLVHRKYTRTFFACSNERNKRSLEMYYQFIIPAATCVAYTFITPKTNIWRRNLYRKYVWINAMGQQSKMVDDELVSIDFPSPSIHISWQLWVGNIVVILDTSPCRRLSILFKTV